MTREARESEKTTCLKIQIGPSVRSYSYCARCLRDNSFAYAKFGPKPVASMRSVAHCVRMQISQAMNLYSLSRRFRPVTGQLSNFEVIMLRSTAASSHELVEN